MAEYDDYLTDSGPFDIEIEQALLGGLMLNNGLWGSVGDDLAAGYFADERHCRLFQVMSRLLKNNQPATPHTMIGELESDDFDWMKYLVQLSTTGMPSSNFPGYVTILKNLYTQRCVRNEARQILRDTYQMDADIQPEQVASIASNNFRAIAASGSVEFRTARQVRLEMTEKMKLPAQISSTGYSRLDAAMGGGLIAGKAYGFMARKKAGKTNLAGGIAVHMNKTGQRSLFIAAEMGSDEIEQRNWARDMERNSLDFLNKKRETEEFQKEAQRAATMADDALLYYDAPGITFDRLQAACTAFVSRYSDAKGIFLDYLQLVGGRERGVNTAEFLDQVAQWIAQFVKQHNVWAVVLMQENQDGGTRGGEAPCLAFDMVFKLNVVDGSKARWLEMTDTRYTMYGNIGSADDPAFKLETRTGPFFVQYERAHEGKRYSAAQDENAKLFAGGA